MIVWKNNKTSILFKLLLIINHFNLHNVHVVHVIINFIRIVYSHDSATMLRRGIKHLNRRRGSEENGIHQDNSLLISTNGDWDLYRKDWVVA